MIFSLYSPYTLVWHNNSTTHIPKNCTKLNIKVTKSGFDIDIADNSIFTQPLFIINRASLISKNNHLCNIINIGKSTDVTIIEYMISNQKHISYNSMQTTIKCADNSRLRHCLLQYAQGSSIISQAKTLFVQKKSSNVSSNIFSFGGISKITLNSLLKGINAQCIINNLAYTENNEQQYVQLNIDHYYPQCISSSLSRSVLKDKSIIDFQGKITIYKGADNSQADLQIKNLLCSPQAQATNKPQLEIYHNNVKCSHGSSTGKLDKHALFYMRSRGLDINKATEILILSFIKPLINTCKIPSIVEYVNKIMASK